jgi:hypothetical protein
MRAQLAAGVAAILAFSGCGPDDGELAPPNPPRLLTVPTNVTRIDVHKGYDGPMLKQIDSSPDIQRIVDFLASHRNGWRYSDSGFPTPPVELFFYSGDQRLGRFGISCAWYFESDLASENHFTLRGIDAPEQDRHALLALLGMPDFHFEGEGCP